MSMLENSLVVIVSASSVVTPNVVLRLLDFFVVFVVVVKLLENLVAIIVDLVFKWLPDMVVVVCVLYVILENSKFGTVGGMLINSLLDLVILVEQDSGTELEENVLPLTLKLCKYK